MKKSLLIMLLLAVSMIANAVPAKRGWQTRIQADGTTVEIQLIGDEFYHFMINRDGKEVRLNDAGMYEVVGEAPSPARVQARRIKAQARRQRKEIGVKPNLAPKGVVILANFADTKMKSEHTRDVFDELCNAANCTVNNGYPSAAEYFADQSDGQYRPTFDVFGPVTLSKGYAYYGKNIKIGDDEQDEFATDAAIEACLIANRQYPELNFADYDSDKDEYVDFVYIIYAGKGEADGGVANTIWPHNWEIMNQVLPFNDDGEYDPEHGTRLSCCYTEDSVLVDGVSLNNYAMSSELSGNASFTGIGTLCHEFGHVIGLPDFYDVYYGTNHEQQLTPGEWNIMDSGSYNGKGHCPPNYDPWEKYFMGWHTPKNLGNSGRRLTLAANGTEDYNAYQINNSGKQEDATQAGLNYYIENRQQQGWDKFVPAAGMLIWKVDYDEQVWVNNEPNTEDHKPRFTLVIPSGTKIGEDYGAQNVWPYNSKNSWTGVNGKPLLEITRDGDKINAIYIEDITSFTVQWIVNGELLEAKEYNLDGTEDLVLPTKSFEACENTKFIGWTTHENWCDPFTTPEDLFTEAQGKVTDQVTYYAVFE